MRLSLVLLLALLSACQGNPEEEAQRYYERALVAKYAGDETRYRALLKHLEAKYDQTSYGRRAKTILSAAPFAETPEATALAELRQSIQESSIRQTLQYLYKAQVKYFKKPRTGVFEEELPAKFLAVGPTPVMVPSKQAVLPTPPGFDDPNWKTLGFTPSDPTRYQYSIVTEGEGAGARLIIRALTDSDGDGIYAVYELHAKATSNSTVEQEGDILVKDEGE